MTATATREQPMPDVQEPLTLKAGCYYRTKNGRKAYCYGEMPDRAEWFVVSIVGGAENCYLVNQRGLGVVTACDLIAEWREPEAKTVTLIMVRHKDGNIQVVKESGKSFSRDSQIIARKKVILVEGEGL